QASDLVLVRVMRDPVRAGEGRQKACALGGHLVRVEGRRPGPRDEVERARSADLAVGERPEEIVVRNARHVAGRVEAGHRGLAALVDPDTGRAVTAAQPDLRDVHLDEVLVVRLATTQVESTAARALGPVQDALD